MRSVPDRSDARIVPFGDAAALIVLGDRIDVSLNQRVHRLATAVRARAGRDDRWAEPVPAYASLLAPYDPLRLSWPEVAGQLERIVADEELEQPVRPADERPAIEIPVRYGGAHGPDLDAVADRLGVTPERVVTLHAARTYRVFMLGFSPGFGYLGTLDPALVLPRRATPRPRVPAGSVAIAGEQTCVYPSATPGGWHLIGHADIRLWDATRQPPALLAPGATVRFRPVPDGR